MRRATHLTYLLKKHFLKPLKREKFCGRGGGKIQFFAILTMTLKRWNFLTQPILKSSSKGSFSKKIVQIGPSVQILQIWGQKYFIYFCQKMVMFFCLLQFQIVRFWQTFFLNWRSRRAEKDSVRQKIIRWFPDLAGDAHAQIWANTNFW